MPPAPGGRTRSSQSTTTSPNATSTHSFGRNTSKMSFLGLRKYPTPTLKPLWPFLAASTLTVFLVAKAQDLGSRSEQWKDDARNPYREQIAKEGAAHH